METDARVIPWVTRSDLTSVEIGDGARIEFAIKDQVRNEFFRFGELEFFILESLRKVMSIANLKDAVRLKFGVSLDEREMTGYINRLVVDNLLVARRLGDGARLIRQREQETSRAKWQQALGVLSIKLPGFYPGPLLKKMWFVGWLFFNPVSLTLILMFGLATIMFACLSFQTIWQRIPPVSQLVSLDHVFAMLVGFIFAKILHELGHGLACQATGHECTEMGVLLLVFMPCMYCDVSDLWTEKDRWKRIFVSLAGVFVELIIATVCFWVWYFSLDGPVHRFAFGLMLVTSANTLFVNGNPLMRYDGYFALSDLLRVPNLGMESRRHVGSQLRSFFLGSESVFKLHVSGALLTTYAVLSWLYRWFIMIAIGWAAWEFFDAQQVLLLGKLSILVLAALSLLPVLIGARNAIKAIAIGGLRFGNTLLFLGVVATVVFAILNISFVQQVRGNAYIELANPAPLFAPARGRLLPYCKDGQQVKAGSLLARIVNEDLELEQISIEGKLKDVDSRLRGLRFNNESSGNAGEIEFWQERRSSWQNKQNELMARIKAFDVLAPSDGQVVIFRPILDDGLDELQDLGVRVGSWAAPENVGNHVHRGESLCYVGDPSSRRGVMQVSEQEIELIQVGSTVKVFLPHCEHHLTGEVTKIALENERRNDADSLPEDRDVVNLGAYKVEFHFKADSTIRPGTVRRAVVLSKATTPLGWLARRWRQFIWI